MNKSLNNIKIGSLTVITGPMFAGKTSLLIEKYNQLKNSHQCLAFKPVIDKRYSLNSIVSHQEKKISAIPITNIQEIENYKNQAENIFIDEIHFFNPNIVPYLEELAKQNKEIIVAGLDWNYFENKSFSTTADLLATAEQVVKLWTKCQIEDCRQKAVKSQWKLTKLPEKPEDYVGGVEKYGSYCRWHYVPINKSEKISQRYNRIEGENARVVIWKDEKFLMVYDIGKGWNLPGGTIDKGETPLECAIREIKEETNLKINNLELLCVEWIYYRDKWWKTHIFETNNFSEKIIKQNSEVSDIKFFACQQAQEQKSEAIATFLPHLIKSMKRRNNKYE